MSDGTTTEAPSLSPPRPCAQEFAFVAIGEG